MIARFFKKIDLFITMTANPNWDKITWELLTGQTSYNHSNLVTCIFKLKKQELINNIYNRNIFGQVPAYMYAIKFQKRGLPHVHLLVVLEENSRLRTPADINSCISSQWPDSKMQPLLFETVKLTMIHGPCGNFNLSVPCMQNGKCTKGYPKAFQQNTCTTKDGYPLYACPDNG